MLFKFLARVQGQDDQKLDQGKDRDNDRESFISLTQKPSSIKFKGKSEILAVAT